MHEGIWKAGAATLSATMSGDTTFIYLLKVCPEASVPLRGRQGSRGCLPDAPGETGIHLECTEMSPPQLESPMNNATSLESFATVRKLHPATTRE